MSLHPTGFISVFIVVFVGLYTLADMTSGGLVLAGVVGLVGLCGLPRLGTPSTKNRNYGYIG
jgi:Flp pilus assembly protein TadB